MVNLPSQKVTILVILLVFLVIIGLLYFSDKGLLQGAKDLVMGAKQYVPNVSIGAEQLSGQTPLPEAQRKDVTALREALRWLETSNNENCFWPYSGLSEFPEDFLLEMEYVPKDKKTYAVVYNRQSRGQMITELNFQTKLIPCVVAGKEEIVDQFYTNYLSPGQSQQPQLLAVGKIQMALNDGGYWGLTENRINYGRDWQDFEGHLWLYKPDKEHVCFFPTSDFYNSATGLDNDYLVDDSDEDSIPYRVKSGVLKKC